jgi:hypothetical protein
LKKKRPKKSSNVTPIDVAAVEARMDELRKVNLDEEQDPAVLRAYLEEMLRNQSALQTQ